MIILIILGLIVVSLLMQGPLDHLILGGICAGALIAWRLIIGIISWFMNRLMPKMRQFNAKEKERLRQAEALDAENRAFNEGAEGQYQKEYQPLYKNALRKIKEQQPTDPKVEQCRKEYEQAKTMLSMSQAAVMNSTILADADKNLETVDFLIKRLESRRADSVKEALNQMDEAQRRDAEKKARERREADRIRLQLDMQRDMQRMERDRQAQWEMDEMQRQWRRDQQAREHQKEMEWKAQQAQWELEEINRKLGRN